MKFTIEIKERKEKFNEGHLVYHDVIINDSHYSESDTVFCALETAREIIESKLKTEKRKHVEMWGDIE